MNPATAKPSTATVLDKLLEALSQACVYNRNDQVPPAVLLWTDQDRQWEPLLPRLRGILPHLLTLGPYDPATRTGPAIWLRCMLARTLPGLAYWPDETIPILYLPEVSRPQLRAVEDCPASLQPLAALQYRGAFFSHANGKDWTIAAFLQSDKIGLGLDVARDNATQEALRSALAELADVEVSKLAGKQLSADDFHALLAPEPDRMILQWLNDPAATREQWGKARWKTFRSVCKKQYDFDPEGDGELAGAERLGLRQKKWESVWQRFADGPVPYPNVPERLRGARPKDRELFETSESWPQDNEGLEHELRTELSALRALGLTEMRTRVSELEERHGPRRSWVWARLDRAPLAKALLHVTALAAATTTPLTGGTLEALAGAYVAGGWQADAAMLAALAAVKTTEDVAAVREAILALYQPWLRDTAERFQQLATGTLEHPARKPGKKPDVSEGTCILFADGLRYDVAQRLRAALEQRGLTLNMGWHWSAIPPVTATAKPALSPVADLLTGTADGDEFCPAVKATGKKLTNDRFHQLLEARGYQILKGEPTGDPSGLAWTECGQIDRTGHDQGWLLARRLDEEVQALADRTAALLAAGWKEVHIVTDHGWLLLPGGLPKEEIPVYLAQERWGRCAVPRPGSKVDLPQRTWHWSNKVWVALAPGITCFVAGKEYAHGSLSLQECVVPEMHVRAGKAAATARIESVKWHGLRCKITVQGDGDAVRADLRTKLADPATSLTTPKPVGGDGSVSLPVEDDSQEGAAAFVVLLDADGQVIDKQSTTVGGDA
jgi:hypothetical protein